MHVHVLQHVAFEGLGSIADWLSHRKARVTYTRFFESAHLPTLADIDLVIALGGPMKFRCGTLKPNYEKYWISDGDAVNAMDPYELILWFRSRGDEVLHPSGGNRQFFIRSGEVVLRVRK